MNASRDQNYVPTLLGVSSADGVTPVTIYVDPTTHRVLVDLASSGAVSGPGTSTDNAIARWNGTGGSAIQDSGVIISDANNVTGVNNFTIGGTATLGSLAGLLKGTAGVVSAATPGTDYYAPGSTDVAVADGGTGASTASGARTNLGLIIGTDVQAQNAKLQQIADLVDPNADRLVFWDDSAGEVKYLTLGTGLSITDTTINVSGGTATLADGDYGDVTASASGTVITIDDDVVTYAKMQNVSATDKILGRSTAGAGDVEEITFTAFARSLADDADATAARSTLGLIIGTNVQAYSANLTTFAGIAPTANVQSLLGAADYAAMRTLLGLVIGTNVQAYDADLTTWAGLTPSANAQSLVTAADYSAMRTLLGLVIGTNVQAYNATLAAVAAGTYTGDNDIVTVGTLSAGNATAIVDAASATAQGKVELATDAEAVTGTDTARAVTPANLTARMAAPGTIGGTTPAAATFTTVTVNTGITLAENASIALDPVGSADGKYSGITVTAVAGYTQAFGDLVYLAVADSRWELADADALATAGNVALAMVVVAGTDGNACTLLLQGIIRADAKFPAMTVGATQYVGETAGAIQGAIPTGADNIIRTVGYALTADELYFNPSTDWQVTVA